MSTAGDYRPAGLLRLFVVPGAVIGANAAALLGALSVVGLVPALAGSARVLGRLEEHGDSAFSTVLAQVRTTWRRDLPVTAVVWFVLAAVAGNLVALPMLDPGPRVLAVGVIVPVGWVVIAWVAIYTALAGATEVSSTDLVLETTRSLVTAPVRAIVTPALVVMLAPLWLLAPLTIACGLAVPAYLVSRLWSSPRP